MAASMPRMRDGSAHLSRWARIETSVARCGSADAFVAPTFRGGRGLKQPCIAKPIGSVVAPTFRGGRGLKHQGRTLIRQLFYRSAHLSRWARIETALQGGKREGQP